MGGTELRQVIRVVIYAVEQVRSARAIEATPGSRECKVASAGVAAGRSTKELKACGPARAGLEVAEGMLWQIQGLLVEEDVGRQGGELRRAGNKLRRQVKVISLAGHRDASDALSDAADAVGAYTEMTRVAFEAGLVG